MKKAPSREWKSLRRRIAPSEGEGSYSPLLVLKIGTSSLIVSDSTGQRVQLANMARLVEVIALLRRQNYRVVLVTSGAVGMGCIKLGLPEKPKSLRTKQAVAAAGQSQLMRLYEDLFATVRVQVAQLLISQSDFLDKTHWVNVKHTIFECLNLGVVPVINENDSTNTTELRFGDNDNLAALLAVQLAADAVFLFTDVDHLYTSNPRTDPLAKALRVVREPFALEVDTKVAGSNLGTGGMTTKLLAARIASAAGIPCCLINGVHPERIMGFLSYEYLAEATGSEADPPLEGTFFMPMEAAQTVGDMRRWILGLPVMGELTIDDGAARALGNFKSLLPAGIVGLSGTFVRNEAVRLMHQGNEVARGLTNFDNSELQKIMGKKSAAFEELLGYAPCIEACHRGNIIFIAKAESLRDLDVVPSSLTGPSASFNPKQRNGSESSISSAGGAP